MWVSDGSEFIADGQRVTCTATAQGDSKFNFLWKEGDGVSQGTHYWVVTLENAADVSGSLSLTWLVYLGLVHS